MPQNPVYDDLLAKVSEQEKEIIRLKEELKDFESTEIIKLKSEIERLKQSYHYIHKSRQKADQEVSEQSQRLQQQDSELKKLHGEFTDQAIKIEEKNVKIQQLEGLLKHLHNSGYLSTKQRERIKAALNL